MNKSTVIHGIRWTLITTVLKRSIGIVLFFLLASWLTKEDFGIFRTYCALLILLSYVGLPGLDFHFLTDKKKEGINTITMLQISSILAFGIFIGLSIAGPALGRLYNIGEMGAFIRYTAFFILIEVWRKVLRAMAQKRLLFKEIALAETYNVLFYSILAMLLLWRFRMVELYIILFFAGNLVEALYLYISLPDLLQSWKKRLFRLSQLRISLANLNMHRRFLGTVSLVNFLAIYSGNAPILFLGTLISPLYMGIYFFASQLIAIPVGMLTGSLGQVFFPVFAKAEPERILSGIKRYSDYVLKLAIPALMLYGLALQGIIPLIFGDKWNSALPLVFYLLIYYCGSFLQHPISGVPFICRRPNWELGWNIATLVLRIGALYLGIMSGFELAIMLFCVVSGVMNLVFYLIAIVLLRGEVLQYIAGLAKALPALIVLALGMAVWQYSTMPILGTITLGGLYLIYLYSFDRPLIADLKNLLTSV